MSRKKGKTYTVEQKTKIVLEILKEEMTTSQLLLHQVTNSTFERARSGEI